MGVRSDKKEQTKPYVSIGVVEIIEDVRRYLGLKSNGETSRRIVLAAFEDWTVLGKIQPFLRWDYVLGDHSFVGHDNHEEITTILPGQYNRTERVPIRFTQDDMKRMEVLHTCLACPWAHMIGALLRLGAESRTVLHKVAPGFVPRSEYSFRRGVFAR